MSESPRKEVVLVALTFLFFTIAIVGFFAYSYQFYGHDELPIGWDTAHYLNQMFQVSKNGIWDFLQSNEFYNVGYTILSSVLVVSGVSPFLVETILPIILCIFVAGLVSIITMRLQGSRVFLVLTALFAPTWFAIYRLGADLHANLLALVFLLLASYFFLMRLAGKSGKFLLFWFALFMVLASFTHVETTAFFGAVFLLSTVLFHFRGRGAGSYSSSVKKISIETFIIIFPVLPSVFVYFNHLSSLMEYSNGTIVSYPPLNIDQWLQCLGILFPVAFLGLFLAIRSVLRKPSRPQDVFICVWACASLAVAVANYALPSIQIFSQRALILFPVPFLIAFGFEEILRQVRKLPSLFHLQASRLKMASAIITITILGSLFFPSLFFNYVQALPASKVWIPPTAYEKLKWLSANKLSSRPIFVFNSNDEYAGGLSDLYNNWVQITYGDHYSYLGDLDFLAGLSETPFVSSASQVFSRIFIDEMRKDGVFSIPAILKHDVVLITDFYSFELLPAYNSAISEIHEGVFVANLSDYFESQSAYIPLYSRMTENSTNGWYSIKRDWCKSIYALEFYDEKPMDVVYSEFLVYIPRAGDYTLKLRYWDAQGGSDLTLELNSSFLGNISYYGTSKPADFTINATLPIGTSVFRIVLEPVSGRPQYASLDYLEVIFDG